MVLQETGIFIEQKGLFCVVKFSAFQSIIRVKKNRIPGHLQDNFQDGDQIILKNLKYDAKCKMLSADIIRQKINI